MASCTIAQLESDRFSVILLLLSLLLLLPARGEAANPMIHAEGTLIVDGDGNAIQLRGVLLEGWLMWNGTLWGAGLTSETTLAARIEELVGSEKTKEFRTAIYENFITKRDIEEIAALGFNVVRVPLNHTVLEVGASIDSNAPGWAYLDRLIDWCEACNVYVVLDLHATPGGQSANFVADPDFIKMWDSEVHIKRTVDLWKAIASRYREREIVAGYDLLNEPDPLDGAQLISVYQRIIDGIRTVDPNHMVILEGDDFAAADFSPFATAGGPLDNNQAYSFHTYDLFNPAPGLLDEEGLLDRVQIAEEHDVPLWNGEFGAHTDQWVAREIALFEDPAHHVSGWIFWPWKRIPDSELLNPNEDSKRYQHLMKIASTPDWDAVRQFLASGTGEISVDLAQRGLDQFINAVRMDNLVTNTKMAAVMQSWRGKILTIDGTDNIFGAGLGDPPGPGGGGAGSLPEIFAFDAEPGQVLTFLSVSGAVDGDGPGIFLWPEGPDGGPFATYLNPIGNLSGIKADSNGFLAGVFLGSEAPASPAPAALDFSASGIGPSFKTLAPELGQVFLIGDGRDSAGAVQQFLVPPTATRLFLGFASGIGSPGDPGFYDDDTGSHTAALLVSRLPTIRAEVSDDGNQMIYFTGKVQMSTNLTEWATLSPQPESPFVVREFSEVIFFRTLRAE